MVSSILFRIPVGYKLLLLTVTMTMTMLTIRDGISASKKERDTKQKAGLLVPCHHICFPQAGARLIPCRRAAAAAG